MSVGADMLDRAPGRSAGGCASAAVGLELERAYILPIDTGSAGTGSASSMEPVEQPREAIPPAAIIPRFNGEAMEADLAWPPHPRGSGDTWPREAHVQQDLPPGRFPIGYAWPMLRLDKRWSWRHEGLESSVSPASAIARVAAETLNLAGAGSPAGPSHGVALVTATSLPSALRGRLERAARAIHLNLTPVSRASAARSIWSARHAEAHLELAPPSPADTPETRPILLHLHLGLDEWEVAAVNLRPISTGDADFCRYHARLPSYGLLLMHQLATRALEVSYRKASMNRAWELLWCSPWMIWTLDVLTGAEPAVPDPLLCLAPHARTAEFVRQQYRFAAQQALGAGIDSPAMLTDLIDPVPRFTDVRDWLVAARQALESARLVGAVITGAMAALPQEPTTLAVHYLRQVWPGARRVLVEGVDLPRGALVHGAVSVCRAMAGRK